jgi:molybdopterin biosynthesis enzyme
MIPGGCDCVIGVEAVELSSARDTETLVKWTTPMSPHSNIRLIGSDIAAAAVVSTRRRASGDAPQSTPQVYDAGHAIDAWDLGVLTCLGFERVWVYKLPTIGVIST